VTSPHGLATTAGLRILQEGGNAVEAALAAAAVIAVVYPHMNGLGGDNFWLIYHAGERRVRALMACGAAGARATIDAYRAAGQPREIPRRGVIAANTVPGAVDGWGEAYGYSQRTMGGRMAFAALLRDALHYAESGFPVTPGQEAWTRSNIGPDSGPFGHLEREAGFRRAFLRPDGSAYAAGEVMVIPDLAATLAAIARDGRDAFYRGAITSRICRSLAARGGMITESDFAGHRSRWTDPIYVSYRDWTVCTTPPPTQGLTSLEILNIVAHFPVAAWGDESPAYYHLMVEAAKQAFVDRDAWIADPDVTPVPVDVLLSDAHGRAQAEAIDPNRAKPPQPLRPVAPDTIWLGTVDAAGNAVSLIQSIAFDFGSGVMADGTGILLHNRGSAFSLDPGHPNALAPGKRPFHTLTPAMALRDGRPELVYGTMGGEGQPQTLAAILTRVLDLGMGVQAAIDAPRWLYGRHWGLPTTKLSLEARVPREVIEELSRLGHDVQVIAPWDDRVGHAQAIWIDPRTGIRHGGADPRGDGLAAGW
jgi:gamma-glutamyltranspeptidase/glutathione hydrolase